MPALRIFEFKWHTSQYLVHQAITGQYHRQLTEVTFDFHRDWEVPIDGKYIQEHNWKAASIAKGMVSRNIDIKPFWYVQEIEKAQHGVPRHITIDSIPKIYGMTTASLCFDYLSHLGTLDEFKDIVGQHRAAPDEIDRELARIGGWVHTNLYKLAAFSLIESPNHTHQDNIPVIKEIFLDVLSRFEIPYVFDRSVNDEHLLAPVILTPQEKRQLPAYYYSY